MHSSSTCTPVGGRRLGRLFAALGLVSLTIGASIATAANPGEAAPAVFARVCSQCHGPDGNAPPGGVPIIAGQQAEYVRGQLRAFKSHARIDDATSRSMWPVAHELDERQIDELAAFVSAQPWRRQPVEGSREQISAGAAIFTRGSVPQGVPPCSGCHGADGHGRQTAPRIAGQHIAYVIRQLEKLQQTNDRPGAREMRPVAHALSADDIANVAAYLQALPELGAH